MIINLPGTSRAAQGVLAVVSDGTGFHREPGSTVLTGLLRSAVLLRDNTGLSTYALLVTADTDQELVLELRRLAPQASAIYLAHTNPGRAQLVPPALAGQVPVITDLQTIAAALTAATLTTLARAEITLRTARVMIAGAERNPIVGLLGTAAGIGHVGTWRPGDADAECRNPVADVTHVTIALRDIATPTDAAPAIGPPSIIAADDPATPLLALPHLLAMARASMRPPGLAHCLAAALALVRETPADRLLPTLSSAVARPV